MIEYIWNLSPNSFRIHIRENGRTLESCNVDQIKRSKVLTELPLDGSKWYRCFRCFPIAQLHAELSAGEKAEGVAQ